MVADTSDGTPRAGVIVRAVLMALLIAPFIGQAGCIDSIHDTVVVVELVDVPVGDLSEWNRTAIAEVDPRLPAVFDAARTMGKAKLITTEIERQRITDAFPIGRPSSIYFEEAYFRLFLRGQ